MVIDCHFHLEERVLSKDGLINCMDRAGVDRTALMGSIIGPFHEPPKPLLMMLQVLLERSSLRSLGRLFVANFTDQGDVKILGKAVHLIPEPDNEGVFDAVRKHPDLFMGWVFINPRRTKDQVAELEKYQGLPGFVGVKAHPFWHHFSPIELAPVAERLARIDKPLLIHCGFNEEGNYGALLDEVPGLKLILAHAGFPEYGDTWKDILPRKNVYLDLSQTSYVSGKATRESVEYLGPDRLLFGTDGPAGFHDREGGYDYGFIKRRIETLFPKEAIRRRLLGENFAELAGMG